MNTGKTFLRVSVKTSGLNAALSSMIKLQSPQMRRKAIAAGAHEAETVVQAYYQNRGRNLWTNGVGPTHGAGRRVTQWWRGTEEWTVKSSNATGAVLENDHIGLSQKITGGTIRAKRKKFLTIPIHPQAHGLTAKQFSRTIAPLFIIKGALMMAGENKGDKPIGVFALKKSVTQKPWPGALPPENSYVTAFMNGVLDVIEKDVTV
jgi:hypothetical protein